MCANCFGTHPRNTRAVFSTGWRGSAQMEKFTIKHVSTLLIIAGEKWQVHERALWDSSTSLRIWKLHNKLLSEERQTLAGVLYVNKEHVACVVIETEVSHCQRTVRAWGPAVEPQVRRRHRENQVWEMAAERALHTHASALQFRTVPYWVAN